MSTKIQNLKKAAVLCRAGVQGYYVLSCTFVPSKGRLPLYENVSWFTSGSSRALSARYVDDGNIHLFHVFEAVSKMRDEAGAVAPYLCSVSLRPNAALHLEHRHSFIFLCTHESCLARSVLRANDFLQFVTGQTFAFVRTA